MKPWLSSVLFPLVLIVMLATITLWISNVTLSTNFVKPTQKPVTKMYDAAIKSFNLDGQLENSITATEIIQEVDSDAFLLIDADIKKYRNGKIVQKISGKTANYNATTRDIRVKGDSTQQDQKDNRMEIIINEF